MQAGRIGIDLPFIQILTVFVENLNAVVVAIVHKNVAGFGIHGHSVYVAEVTRTSINRTPRRSAELAPIHYEFAVFVELRHARAGIPIGDEKSAVGEPVHVSRTIEVGGVRAGLARSADGLQ